MMAELVRVFYANSMPTLANLVVSVGICLVAFHGDGSPAYLVVAAWMLATTLWRVREFATFARAPELYDPHRWARRGIAGSAMLAAGWAVMAVMVPVLAAPTLAAMLLGALSSLVIAGAVRNCAIRAASHLQVALAGAGMVVGCGLSASLELRLYAFVVVIQALAAIGMVNTLNRELVQNRQNEREARELAAELARANASLALLNNHLQEEVAIDSLTGLANRRAFDVVAAREWRIAAREHLPLAVLMIDVDYFKRYNDCYGHQAGDDCLRIVAELIAQTFQRPSDIVARYGGEEFIAVLSSTTEQAASDIAERLIAVVAARGIVHDASPVGVVSLSVGIAATVRTRDTTLQALIGTADTALYAAKNAGRNRARAVTHIPAPTLAGELA